MKASVHDMGDVVVMSLIGQMDFESVAPFKAYCLKNLSDKRVVIDMKELQFVGSSGITTFLETLQELKSISAMPPRFAGVSSEFKRLFTTVPLAGIEMFENAHAAIYGTSAEIIPDLSSLPQVIEGEDEILELESSSTT